MYENIRKPDLLKPIPLMWLRALPALYYYGKYIGNIEHPRCRTLFSENITYLSTVLKDFNRVLKNENISTLIDCLRGIADRPHHDILAGVVNFTQELARVCSENTKLSQKYYKENKQTLIKQYRLNVKSPRVLLCGIKPDHKVNTQLQTFCHYTLAYSDIHSRDYAAMLAENDIVILGDTPDTSILTEVDQMHSYHMPVVIILIFNKWESDDSLRSRHARQLIRMGIPVIYKVITPIRLFTTIDKTFMKYHLSGSINQL